MPKNKIKLTSTLQLGKMSPVAITCYYDGNPNDDKELRKANLKFASHLIKIREKFDKNRKNSKSTKAFSLKK